MATKFSPCKGSYVLNQFPSNVMFGMNGFHVSASGAIQGHRGPLVYRSAVQVLKTLWEKEKLLVMSNFSFSINVFYPFGEHSAIFIKFIIVVCKNLQFGRIIWERVKSLPHNPEVLRP